MADQTPDKRAAMALGCRCTECPLADAAGPVLPERGGGSSRYLLLADYPDQTSASRLRPFVGPGEKIVKGALRNAGISRRDTVAGYAVACRGAVPMEQTLARLRARNAERRKRNTALAREARSAGVEPELLPMLPTPMECCLPGVVAALRSLPERWILAAGKLAASSLLGGNPSIHAIRGGILDGNLTQREDGSLRLLPPDVPAPEGETVIVRDARIVPTLDPGLVLAQQRWTDAFQRDLDRLVRWSRGALSWREPEIVYHPAPHELEAFLSGPGPFTYDVETDGIEALDCNVRCVGIGNGTGKVVVVGTRSRFTSREQPAGEDAVFYPPAVMAQVKDVLRRFFADPARLKIGHNAGYYDRMVIRAWLGVEPEPTLDTILLHRLAESELPHSLGYVGSKYTDVHSWKADRQGRKLAVDAETDRELHHYCGIDVAVTAACVEPLVRDVRLAEQDKLIATDHAVQRVCADMHHVGMFVDQNARAEAERNALARTVALRKELADLAGDPDFNPGSTQQLRRLLFRDWSLTPKLDDKIRFTASGDASTSDDVLRALFTQRMKKPQRLFVKKLRQYRKVMKELGTYIVKLRPMTDVVSGLGWDDDARRLEWEAERDPELLAMMAAEREKRGYANRGIVWADGRMRPGYNAHVTVSGRLSSSSPINAQNFPKHLRKLIVPQPGNVLVGADYDQLELRIAAARWGLRKYLDAFDAGWDPHTSVTAYSVFGEDFVKAAGTPFPWMTGTNFQGDANDMRQLAKIIQYAFQYKASVETGARIIQSTELTDEETGDPILPYARLSVKQVRQMRQSWLDGIPQLPQGWDAEIAHYRSYGWVAEPVHGRRRYFLDGENPNEIVNTPIQGAASALVNDAMIAIHKDIPLHKWGPGTGLLTQTHDALVVECPEHAAPWVVECINHHMNKRHPDLPGVLFSAAAEIGMTWKEVG